MFDETKFEVINENGEEIECEVVFTFEDEKTGKHYIAYTDDSIDEDGNTALFASIFDPDSDSNQLLPIETDEEWEMIEDILQRIENGEIELD